MRKSKSSVAPPPGCAAVKRGVAHEDETISLGSLSCPILAKIWHAFNYAKKAVYAEADGDVAPGSRILRGKWDSTINMMWDEEDMELIVAFRSPEKGKALELLTTLYDRRRSPLFLKNAAPEAEVHSGMLDMLEYFQKGEDGKERLADMVKEVTGGATPRRVVLTGFCFGGSLATIAACWAGLQSPTSDVRCITFGAPNVGNAAFVEAFRWVVGVSYKVGFGGDPVQNWGGGMLSSFEAVPGSIHLDADANMEWGQPWQIIQDKRDHCILHYEKGIMAACKANKAAEKRLCAADPHGNNVCSLKRGFRDPVTPADALPHQALHKAEEVSHEQSNMIAERGPPAEPLSQPEPHTGDAGGTQNHEVSTSGADSNAQHAPASDERAGENVQPSNSKHAAGGDQAEDRLDSRCTRSCADMMGRKDSAQAGARAEESDEARRARHQAEAAGLFRSVLAEATGDQDMGVAEPPRWLTRAFSLLERDDLQVDLRQLHTLQKVLSIGKISSAVVLAGAAYQDEAGYARMTGLALDKTRLLDDKGRTDTQVHVSWIDSGTAVFSFRGTESAQDGLQDVKMMRRHIDYLQRAYPGAKAHTGFLQQFASVVDDANPAMHMGKVLRELSGGRSPNRVLCTGHSLGGALATLGAAWAAIEYPHADVRCVTFGSPRVANRKFKRAFHALVATSLRLSYGSDPVPNLPPAFRYDHVGSSIHVRKAGLDLKARPWHFAWRPNVGDHFLDKYTAGVYSLLPGGLDALPSFKDVDFKIPADAMNDPALKMGGCFRVSRTPEPEHSDDSDPDSPHHPDTAAGKEEGAEDGKRKHSLRSQSSDGHSNGGNLLMRLLSRKSGNGRRRSVEDPASGNNHNGLTAVPEDTAAVQPHLPDPVPIAAH